MKVFLFVTIFTFSLGLTTRFFSSENSEFYGLITLAINLLMIYFFVIPKEVRDLLLSVKSFHTYYSDDENGFGDSDSGGGGDGGD